MKSIPDGSVDMVLCDLPYGTTKCKWDSIIPFAPLWMEYWRICKPNAAVVLTASQPFTSLLVTSQIDKFKHSWVWNKAKAANFVQVKRHPLKIHEDVLVFGNFTYKPQMTQGVMRKKGGYKTKNEDVAIIDGAPSKVNDLYYPKSILEFSIADNKSAGIHPTQKPVSLFEYLIKTYTNEGDTVLDNTAGSGTTAIAAINTNRKWICIEMDEGYSLKAMDRIRNHIKPETSLAEPQKEEIDFI